MNGPGPLLLVVAGGAAIYLGLEARKSKARADREGVSTDPSSTYTYCDIAGTACGPNATCVPVYGEGEAPPGFENTGICMSTVPQGQN